MDDARISDAIRAFLESQKEENSYIRHYEETRFKITQLTVTLSGILLGILRFGEHQYTLFIGVFIAALGVLGALVSMKYTERADRHAALSRAYRRAASKLIGGSSESDLEWVHNGAVLKHVESGAITRMFSRTRARLFWVFVHLCIIALGLAIAWRPIWGLL